MRPFAPILASAALVALTAAPAMSQTRPPPPGYERPEAGERPEADEAAATADLVRQLNLRPDQQAAFRDYQAAFAAQGDDREDGDDVARLAAMTTPQRLDDSARQMDRERADFERVAAATRRFYASLDEYQRRTFDRLTAPQAEPADDEDDRGPPPARPSNPR